MHIPKRALACALALTACVSAKADPLQLSSPRAANASIVLEDGRVLLLGGCVRNGCEAGPASAMVDMFDPRAGTFVNGGRLLAAKVVSEAVKLPDGRIFVVGGWEEGRASASAEVFDPKSGRSLSVGALSTTRGDVSAVGLADGRVLVAGGFDGRQRLAGAEVFDPRTGKFTPVGPLNEARSGTELVILKDGRVLVVGGVTGGPGATMPLASAEIFDPATGRFTPTGPLHEARFKHAALRLPDGRVLVIAGSDERERGGGKKRTLEIYDPMRGEFTPGGLLHHARYKLTDAVALLADGRVLIGGSGRYPEVYDPETQMSAKLAVDLGRSWNFMTAVTLVDGRVLLAGGYSEDGLEVSDRTWVLAI